MSELQSATRENVSFGEGSFIGQIARDREFFELDVRDQARLAGWADSCPVVEELTDPANPAPERGPENMLNRYSEINFWFGQICRETEAKNFELSLRLHAPVLRLRSEPVGKYEPESVPENHDRVISPMGTLPGFALPRMFVEQLKPEGGDSAELARRMATGLKIVREAAANTTYPSDFMATVAEGLAQADADPMRLLKHIVGKGWMDEHNADHMLDQAKRSLEEHAPKLWELYSNLTPEEKAQHKFV